MNDEVDLKGYEDVACRVKGVRTTKRNRILFAGILVMAALFVGGFLIYSAIDIWMKLGVVARANALTITLAAVVAGAFIAIFRPIKRLGGLGRTARDIETKYPQIENNLSTAIEYGNDRNLVNQTSSPALVEALIQQTVERTSDVDFKKSVDWRRVGRASLAALLLAAVACGYYAWSPRLLGLTWQRFANPMADLPPPTLTVIDKVTPGTVQVPLESSQKIGAELSGRIPPVARVRFQIGQGEWQTAWMDAEGDGRFSYTLRRLLEDVSYQVSAGDAESPELRIEVYVEPQIDELEVTLEHPEYTGRKPEVLPPGQGDIRALAGSKATVRGRTNVELASAKVRFSSDPRDSKAVPAVVDGRGFTVNFNVEKDDRYAIEVCDRKGRPNKSPAQYRVTALPDKPPVVRIRKPAPDISAHRNQELEVEIEATDDYGVREMGIYHSLGMQTEKMLVKRFDPCPLKGASTLKWNLALQGFKGGEVVAYYAYAADNDARTGPKESRSSIQFITLYDEDEYLRPKGPKDKKKHPPTPEAVKQLDKLIEAQKRLLRDTFNAAQTRVSVKGPITDAERKTCARLKDSQGDLKEKLDTIIREVKDQLEAMPKEEPKAAGGHHGEGDDNKPKDTGLGAKELKHLEQASDRMDKAKGLLGDNAAEPAVPPETEALRHLSETRRLMLSDQEGDARMRQAMNQQSKSKRRKQQEKEQEDQQQQQIQEELAQLPPMLDRQKEIDRDIEELIRKKAQAQPGQPQPPEEQKEQRRLRRKAEENLKQQAEEAQQRAEQRQRMQQENMNLPNDAAQKAEESRKKLEEAMKHLEQGQPEKAQDAANEAMKKRLESDRRLEQGMNKQFEQAMKNALQDARRMTDEQQAMAEQSRQEQQAQQQQQQGGQPMNAEQQEAMKQAMAAASQKQGEMAEDMKGMKERLEQLADQAKQRGSPAEDDLKNAAEQAGQDRETRQAMDKAKDALDNAKPDDAAKNQQNAADGMARVERRLAEAASKHASAEAREIAQMLQKARELAARQAAAENEVREGKAPQDAAKAQEQNAKTAADLAREVKEVAPLRKGGRADRAAEHFEKAAGRMTESNRNLDDPNQKQQAAEAAAKATQEAKQAAGEIEGALSEALQNQANEAARLAQEARENEEKTAGTLKATEPDKQPEKNLADAKETQSKAATATRRLEGALKDLAQQTEAGKSDVERQAKDLVDRAAKDELPERTSRLDGDIAQARGKPSEGAKKAPEMAERGEKIASDLSKIEKDLQAMISDIKGKDLDRMKSAEEKARESAEQSQQLAQETGKQPDGKPEGERKKTEQTQHKAEDLERNVEGLVARLKKLLPNSKEQKEAEKALDKIREANAQLPKGPQGASGAFSEASKNLQRVGRGLVSHIEREIKAREISEPADETAPKQYRTLIEKYYKALSEDTEK